jgi:ABC-type sulfate transport system substrate-binding protein
LFLSFARAIRKTSKIGTTSFDPDVSVVIPNPKTSGNGRYSYLAAWGYALKKSAGDEKQARDFVGKLFANVPVLDTGGRGATTPLPIAASAMCC